MRLRRRTAAIVAAAVSAIVVAGMAAPAQASTTSDADTAMTAFVNQYWDSSKQYFYTNSDHTIHSAHAYGPSSGLYSDFWWEAQMMETVTDAYKRTNSSTYRTMIDQVYNGWVAAYPNPTVTNGFNDDLGWWALACADAYNATKSTTYKTCATNLFSFIWSHQDSTYGGGIWWRNDIATTSSQNQKNVATNAPAALTAAELYSITGDTTYLTDAKTLFSWVQSTLQSGGQVYDHVDTSSSTNQTEVVKWNFSYNFGTYIGAAEALYKATNDSAYLTTAKQVATWATSNLTNGGTFLNEGDSDAGGFKAILIRYLNQLATDGGQSQYLPILKANINQAWNHRRTSDSLVGQDWSAPTQAGSIQSMTAMAAADAMQVVTPDGSSGLQPENGIYEAENAVASTSPALNAESSNTGFTGRGYLAGWNTDGQAVTFQVNVPTTGTYELGFRYAGAAGDATRQVTVNGTVLQANQKFPATSAWSTWNTVTLNGVSLNQGSNSIKVAYSASAGSTQFLNLDQLQVSAQIQAENGTLHNLTTENSNSGYTGSGYIAGWNSNGQYVDLPINVSKAGKYTLVLRYAAAAGAASRYLFVNGAAVVNNQSFPSTSSWTGWSTVTVSNVTLNSGANTISVIYDSSKGSAQYLNFDEATLRCTLS